MFLYLLSIYLYLLSVPDGCLKLNKNIDACADPENFQAGVRLLLEFAGEGGLRSIFLVLVIL